MNTLIFLAMLLSETDQVCTTDIDCECKELQVSSEVCQGEE